jgi:hypothetical protein
MLTDLGVCRGIGEGGNRVGLVTVFCERWVSDLWWDFFPLSAKKNLGRREFWGLDNAGGEKLPGMLRSMAIM